MATFNSKTNCRYANEEFISQLRQLSVNAEKEPEIYIYIEVTAVTCNIPSEN